MMMTTRFASSWTDNESRITVSCGKLICCVPIIINIYIYTQCQSCIYI